ncbi:MAG: LrgB family protein [Christensenellaceae bacterium]|nr:LrgB family protein [Christensenellaceae bacterium]
MNGFDFLHSPYFGLAITLAAYTAGTAINRKTRIAVLNPVIISLFIILAVLFIFRIDYETYYEGGQYINMLLIPATVCLAVPIYNKRELLKKNLVPILAGCAVGAVVCIVCVVLLCRAFGIDGAAAKSLIPKSITTPFGMSVSETIGGMPSLTVICIIITGITGAVTAPYLAKLFRINDDIAEGIAIGTSSHVLGTGKALEMSETHGAMSGLAVPITGVITVIIALIFFT